MTLTSPSTDHTGPTAASSFDEGCETLRWLRHLAANHYDTISNWLIMDLIDQALAQLGSKS